MNGRAGGAIPRRQSSRPGPQTSASAPKLTGSGDEAAPPPDTPRSALSHWLAFSAVLLGASAWFQPSVAGSDLWWHLASGRELWKRGPFALTADPFSYTFGGREWMNHE